MKKLIIFICALLILSPLETVFGVDIEYNYCEGTDDNCTITKAEMAELTIKALGFESLIETDAMDLLKNLGIEIEGAKDESATNYDSSKIIDKLSAKPGFVNSFYAINSYAQADFINYSDSVSFGWAKVDIDSNNKVYLNMNKTVTNDYGIPDGFTIPVNMAKEQGIPVYLMVTGSGIALESMLSDEELRRSMVEEIVETLRLMTYNGENISFDGVVIDFENLKSSHKENLNLFLKDLRSKIGDKALWTAVHPLIKTGEYYDGYDYETIGELSDTVIIMAHDYNAKKLTDEEKALGFTVTPLSPINEVYYVLNEIKTKNLIAPEKVLLQVSFDTCQWKIKDDVIINEYPYSPSYDLLYERMKQEVSFNFSKTYLNPYISFYNSDDNTHNVIWYEDTRSVDAKAKLCSMMGFKGISIWRMGNIPDFGNESEIDFLNVMEYLKNYKNT